MDAQRVNVLSHYLAQHGLLRQDDTADLVESLGLRDEAVSRFACSYKNANFGYQAMELIAEAGVPYPPWLNGEDIILHRLYCYFMGMAPDDVLEQALTLMTPRSLTDKHIVDALLLAKDSTIEKVAEVMGMKVEAVLLYEKAFFNVIDRRKDQNYLREQAFPNMRMSEMVENYMHTEEARFILRRAGMQNGMKDVLYFAGLVVDLEALATSAQAAKQLESVLLVHGLMMARNGFAHQDNSHALRHAKTLVTAAKMSGQDMSTNETDELPNVGDALKSQMRVLQAAKVAARERAIKVAEVVTTDADAKATGQRADPVKLAGQRAGVEVYTPPPKT